VIARHPDGRTVKRYQSTLALQPMEGRIAELCLYAGMGVGDIGEIVPAAELVETIWRDCAAALNDGVMRHKGEVDER